MSPSARRIFWRCRRAVLVGFWGCGVLIGLGDCIVPFGGCIGLRKDGKGGESFFPKLGEDQMLTFSSICDKFVIANGLVKDPCDSDDEAKRKAAALGWDDNKYPTVYFGSDTTGEKAYEEFYVPGEKVDIQRFKALGVVCQTTRHEMDEVNGFFEKLEGIFAKEDFTKAQVVEAIKEFIPNFEHEEKGKNLDQKM